MVETSIRENFRKVFISDTGFKNLFQEAEDALNLGGGVEITARGRMNTIAIDLALMLEGRGLGRITDTRLYTDTNPKDNRKVSRICILLLKPKHTIKTA